MTYILSSEDRRKLEETLKHHPFDSDRPHDEVIAAALSLLAGLPKEDARRVRDYEAGWDNCAVWAGREDLLSDTDSPAYIKERDEKLAAMKEHPQPCPHPHPPPSSGSASRKRNSLRSCRAILARSKRMFTGYASHRC